MANYYVLLTDYGMTFTANAQAGTQLALTHVMLGDANDQPYLPESRLDKTALVNQRSKLPIASVTVVNETTAEVTAIVPSNVGGFNVHEVGIADSSGKLVYVGNFHGGYRPTLTEGAGGDMELVITIKADNLATVVIETDGTVVTASRDWVTEHFVTKPELEAHLDADNPHDQYVLKATYDQHVIENGDEHQGFVNWQQQHLAAPNPHPQYVLKSTYDSKVEELVSRLNMLASAINNNAVEDEYSVALLSLRVEHKIFSDNPSAVTTRVTETQKVGLPFASYTNSVPVSQSQQNPATYEFSVDFPASYDASIHRILALGGQAHRVESNRVVFELLTNVVEYTYSPGGDQNDQTGYRSTIDTTVQVEMFSTEPPPAESGLLVGMLSISYADTARSANDNSGSGAVTLNDASGYPFAYPLTIDLAKPVTNAPQPYDLDIKIILPVEYDSAKHDLTVTNSAGSYLINQADRSIDFSSLVTSVKQADDEVLDALNATFNVEIRNK